MRDVTSWRRPIVRQLERHWREGWGMSPGAMCEVELGITLLESICPEEGIAALPILLAGYALPPARGAWTPEQRRRIGVARHLLLPLKNPHAWRRALEDYISLPQWVRGYDYDSKGVRVVRREVSDAATRWDVYARALEVPAAHRLDRLPLATTGSYLARTRRGATTVAIPADVPLPSPPNGHVLARGNGRQLPIEIPWQELGETARWMDEESMARGLPHADWAGRFERVQLETRDAVGTRFRPTKTLRIDRVLHLAGMVGAGKSSLMDILAVWAARRGMRTTVVVGDVVGALRRTTLFRSLGLAAAPILGQRNRRRHTERLHRIAAGEGISPVEHDDPGFDFLSTACGLDGLRNGARPFLPGDNPCGSLELNEPEDDDAADEGPTTPSIGRQATRLGCPFFGVCQQHRAARELVTAPIWVATPASLVHTRVPAQLNAERLRYAELAYRASDLVIIDEADRVQVQLDATFSPSDALIGGSRDSWFDDLDALVGQELRRSGRGPLGETAVSTWVNAFDVARAAGNRIYALLNQEPLLRRAIQRDYFTEWTLATSLAREWTGATERAEAPPAYRRLVEDFDAFIQYPVGGREDGPDHPLTILARQVLTVADEAVVRRELRSWLDTQPDLTIPAEATHSAVVRLEFALVLAVLADRLALLLRLWPQVEGPLNLEASTPLFHRPPEDFAPVIPEAPMGNQLGFQYLHPEGSNEPGQMGELRFFRCMGVGRWVLLHLHDLFSADGIPGPHVLLLSGTSWAGTSPSYHIQIPVGGVLRAPQREVAAVAESTFRFLPLVDEEQRAIRVSGRRGGERRAAIRGLLAQLVRRSGLGNRPSLLERELADLPAQRQRALILVGSYEEARHAQEDLVRQRPDWAGRVLRLRADADEDEFGGAWAHDLGSLRRGDVERFAATGATILIAPLLAVERGHNILNEVSEAAIGAAYFLVRPHPRPDDIHFAIQAINRWAVEHAEGPASICGTQAGLAERGARFRNAAYRRWRQLLMVSRTPYRFLEEEERQAQTWSQLVSIWQVIGRLVRGGSPAKVYFCDAAFAPHSADKDGQCDDAKSSLLVSMLDILRPYFVEQGMQQTHADDRPVVQLLYAPLYTALAGLKGVVRADV